MTESLQEQIDRAAKRLGQLKERQRKADARTRSAASRQARADDTRRKILAGALVLDEHSGLRAAVLDLMREKLTREDDRRLFGLSPLGASSADPAPAPAGGEGVGYEYA